MKSIAMALALLAAGTASAASAQSIMGPSKIVGVTSTITNGNPTYPLSQINDGNFNAAAPFNGFQGTNDMLGTITFTLDQSYDLTQFYLWNDINVRAEGVATYMLNFYDANGNQVGAVGGGNVAVGSSGPHINTFPAVNNVRRVELVVQSVQAVSQTFAKRVEIREVAFEGRPAAAPPIDVKGDHFQCYRVPESKPLNPEKLQVSDQFGRGEIVLGRPVMICNPSTKVHNGKRYRVANPAMHLVCYDIVRQPDAPRRRGVNVNNQMGPTSFVVADRQSFCVPSIKKPIDFKESPLDQ
ncbi:MAG: hypothetical protein ACKOPQ_03230 [Novosphingobium sp.]